VDRAAVVDEMERARTDFHRLLDTATSTELRAGTDGTKWSNEQLLFHMLFGYLIVRTLLGLVRLLARAPDGVSRRFAAALDAATGPFHVINYLGSRGGARILGHAGMERLLDRVITHLQANLVRETDEALASGMHFPLGWDPYFQDVMTVGDVYHYGTQHYDHHRKQLTLAAATA